MGIERVCLKRRCTLRTAIKLQLLNEKRDDLPSKLESTFFSDKTVLHIYDLDIIYIIIYIYVHQTNSDCAEVYIKSICGTCIFLHMVQTTNAIYLGIYMYIGSLKSKCFVNLITIPGMNIQVIQVPCPRSDIYN